MKPICTTHLYRLVMIMTILALLLGAKTNPANAEVGMIITQDSTVKSISFSRLPASTTAHFRFGIADPIQYIETSATSDADGVATIHTNEDPALKDHARNIVSVTSSDYAIEGSDSPSWSPAGTENWFEYHSDAHIDLKYFASTKHFGIAVSCGDCWDFNVYMGVPSVGGIVTKTLTNGNGEVDLTGAESFAIQRLVNVTHHYDVQPIWNPRLPDNDTDPWYLRNPSGHPVVITGIEGSSVAVKVNTNYPAKLVGITASGQKTENVLKTGDNTVSAALYDEFLFWVRDETTDRIVYQPDDDSLTGWKLIFPDGTYTNGHWERDPCLPVYSIYIPLALH